MHSGFTKIWYGLILILAAAPAVAGSFRIHVIDAATSRGIPLVVLQSSLNTRHVTDSNGLVAFDLPVAMGQDLFFKPESAGYHYNAPGLAMGGVVLHPESGSSATIVMQRDMIAERLYRITGAGIYRDTVALGETPPIEHPMLNAGVIGQDSAFCTLFGGRYFWIWGDTARMRHPLATNFAVTGAYSDLPTSGGLPVERGINLEYISDKDFVKHLVPRQAGDSSGVYWLSCVVNAPDENGKEHLVAWCANIEGPSMKILKRRIMEFDPVAEEFHTITDYPTTAPLQPGGHATRGGDYFYFTGGSRLARVRASYAAVIDPAQYEAYTCLANEGEFSTATAQINRGADGQVEFQWKRGVAAISAKEQQGLVDAGLMSTEDCMFLPVDAATGKRIVPHGCDIAWNDYRKRWTMIVTELGGASLLGEIWYLESKKPEGPWIKAVKVLTHHKYSFYNPLQHPHMAAGSRYLYFEGTYTRTFSGGEISTPWYDYNQVMYRIDLDDPRLAGAK